MASASAPPLAPPPLKPVYALVGSDAFLQLQHLRALLAQEPDATRIDFDGERTELAPLLDELRSFSMFGGRKFAVVGSAEALLTRFRSQLEEYVAAPAAQASLVLRLSTLPAAQRIAKAIAKAGQILDCNPPRDLARWIIDRARGAHAVTIAPDAARLLADSVGDDLGRLDNELAKLALGIPVGSASNQITAEQVGSQVAFQRDQQLSEMVNAVAAGRPADAVRAWRQMLVTDPSVEFRAVTWLTLWIGNVRKALALRRRGVPPASIPQTLRIWPREMQQPFMQTAIALGDAGATRALHHLAEVDRHNKSGVGDPATNVERFILDLSL